MNNLAGPMKYQVILLCIKYSVKDMLFNAVKNSNVHAIVYATFDMHAGDFHFLWGWLRVIYSNYLQSTGNTLSAQRSSAAHAC